MNTKRLFEILFVALFVLVVGVSAYTSFEQPAPAAQAAPAADFADATHGVIADVDLMFHPQRYMDFSVAKTGYVSITCWNRTLFQYHNEDPYECGIIATLTAVVDDVRDIFTATVTATKPSTSTKTATPTMPTPPTVTGTPSPTDVVTSTPTDTSTQTATPTNTPSPTASPTDKPTEVVTDVPTATPEPKLKCKDGEYNTNVNGKPTCAKLPDTNSGQATNTPHGPATTKTPKPEKQGGIGLVLFAIWGYRTVAKGMQRRVKLFSMNYSNAEELVAVCKKFDIKCDGAMPESEWNRIYNK